MLPQIRALLARHRCRQPEPPTAPATLSRYFAGCTACRTQGPLRVTVWEADQDAWVHMKRHHGGRQPGGVYIEASDLLDIYTHPRHPTRLAADEGDPAFLAKPTR